MACPDGAEPVDAAEVLMGTKACGQKALVVGGGLVGCETALWLARQGKDVTVVERLDTILSSGRPVPHMNREMLINLLAQAHVKTVTSASLLEIRGKEAVLIGKNLCKWTVSADTVVSAIGFAPDDRLFQSVSGRVANVYRVGDCETPLSIMDAIWSANEVAMNL